MTTIKLRRGGVVLYRIFAGERDEFAQDFDDAVAILRWTIKNYAGTGHIVGLYVEEYENEENLKDDRIVSEDYFIHCDELCDTEAA